MEKTKNILIVALFSMLIFGFGIAHILLPDAELSRSERRKLDQLPEITADAVFSREFSDDLESYLLDQFPLREDFRTINAVVRFFGLLQKDTDGIWISDGSVFKTEYPMKENQLNYGANIINTVIDTYLSDMNVYFSLIPDKNYFAAAQNGYPSMDYEEFARIMRDKVNGAEYIDIFGELALDDYYSTDPHWNQPDIFPVLNKLAEAMGVVQYLTPESDYTAHELYPFYGAYMGQAALPFDPDTLTYLTSADTESATVTGIDSSAGSTIYVPDRITGMDGYDVFLSGAQSVLTIECPNARTDRELIIFRDSFGSSIAPLFTGAYSKITLVDLRYIPSAMLGDYVEFTPDQDVLFLYSTVLLNSAMLMK